MVVPAISIDMVTRFSIEDYHRLRDLGLLSRHTELIEGVLIDKMTISPLHSYIVSSLRDYLTRVLPDIYFVREEKPVSIENSEPEPDISVVSGRPEDFRDAHPTTAGWVIEVAVTTLELDLNKARIYAKAGIAHYWIIDPEQNRTIVYSQPGADGYLNERIFKITEEIPVPLLAGMNIRLDRVYTS